MDLAIKSITKRWNFISENWRITKNEFVEAVRFLLESTFFTFDNQIYKQKFGTRMSSPLSPVIVDIIMQNLEKSILDDISIIEFPVKFYYRYVDDIVILYDPFY